MDHRPPLYIALGQLLSTAECARIIAESDSVGWQRATVITGAATRNSDIRSIDDPDSEWVARCRDIATLAAPLLQIAVTPAGLTSIQIGRYAPGQNYDWHTDHDTSRAHLDHDRKLSIVGSLSDGGGLELDHIGDFKLNQGDVLVFSGILGHRAPIRPHTRYTFVAWCPGPNWQ